MAALLEGHTHILLMYQSTIAATCRVTNYHKTQLKRTFILTHLFAGQLLLGWARLGMAPT